MAERLKILLGGMVAGDPNQGGATWAVLQYLLGLAELGHDVLLVEQLRRGRDRKSDVSRYFEKLPFLEGRAALLSEESDETIGLPFDRVARFASEADLLINISGMLRDDRLLAPIPVRAFLDLDPGFNQAWHESGHDMGFDRHTHFVTVGQCLGSGRSSIPDCGRRWHATLPPVVLAHWTPSPRKPRYEVTSVGNWRSYGSLEREGIHYGQRAHSLRGLIDLPRMTQARFQMALGIHPDEVDDLKKLARGGWELVDPLEVAATPAAYMEFIRASRAELCVAKSGYVASGSGWISDRSAAYLACGRPVVAQETGIGSVFPTGSGFLTFSTVDEAAAAVEAVLGSWDLHSATARQLAEEHLDSRRVLTDLLAGLSGSGSPVEIS